MAINDAPPPPNPLPHQFGRHLRKELGRAEEISQTARNILEPVLLNARSCLGVAEGVSGAAVEQPHRRGTENRGQFKRAAMKPSELGNGGDDGDLREVRSTWNVLTKKSK